eukprot:CAMPEP_0113551300 /NCGR_PEP_ID=MMETSP0015_2-20120614/14451_1 /TAXON_ID=2838 /ORGANISM="Odontella" /LENGTH=357 /DNA_ID=CAMNT_0000452183 /DNA_START=291 /DNA_END=1361 /DNA_ORIENTATION=+ /assembly_acc=CAM_ASM_000160
MPSRNYFVWALFFSCLVLRAEDAAATAWAPSSEIPVPRFLPSAAFADIITGRSNLGATDTIVRGSLSTGSPVWPHARHPPAVVYRPRSVALRMSSPSGDGKKKSKTSGVYARPSAAIERGSGFFIPGLEGSRVRLLFGAIVLVLTYVNRMSNEVGAMISEAQFLSETVAVVYGLLLLLQAAVEFGKELGFGVEDPSAASMGVESGPAATTASGPSASVSQIISPDLASMDRVADAVRWAAATFVALTPATHVLLLGTDNAVGSREVYYSLGDFTGVASEQGGGISAAVDTVFASKGGRVSIPSDHPASVALLPESFRRCVLLQTVGTKISAGGDSNICLMVGSDKLLPSFTKNDLRW